MKFVVVIFLINLVFALAYSSFSQDTANPPQGEQIFKSNCSGCHLHGQNLIKSDKPIIGSTKLKSKNSFKEFLSVPHPPMPNFKNIADESGQLDALYGYVMSLMGT